MSADTIQTIFGWTIDQWFLAWAEHFDREPSFDEKSAMYWCWEAGMGDYLNGKEIRAAMQASQAAWWKRHAFPPGRCPILIPDGFRSRGARAA